MHLEEGLLIILAITLVLMQVREKKAKWYLIQFYGNVIIRVNKL